MSRHEFQTISLKTLFLTLGALVPVLLAATKQPSHAICVAAKPFLERELARWAPQIEVIDLARNPAVDLCRFKVNFSDDMSLFSYAEAYSASDLDPITREYVLADQVYSVRLVLQSANSAPLCGAGHDMQAVSAASNLCYQVAPQALYSDLTGSEHEGIDDQLSNALTAAGLTAFSSSYIGDACALDVNFATVEAWVKNFLEPRLREGRPLSAVASPSACIPIFPSDFETFNKAARATISN